MFLWSTVLAGRLDIEYRANFLHTLHVQMHLQNSDSLPVIFKLPPNLEKDSIVRLALKKVEAGTYTMLANVFPTSGTGSFTVVCEEIKFNPPKITLDNQDHLMRLISNPNSIERNTLNVSIERISTKQK